MEREGFQEFVKVLQPRFDIPSRRTATRDCMALFEEERELEVLVLPQTHGHLVKI